MLGVLSWRAAILSFQRRETSVSRRKRSDLLFRTEASYGTGHHSKGAPFGCTADYVSSAFWDFVDSGKVGGRSEVESVCDSDSNAKGMVALL
jgi:hypothetical protein